MKAGRARLCSPLGATGFLPADMSASNQGALPPAVAARASVSQEHSSNPKPNDRSVCGCVEFINTMHVAVI
eukprot:564727-Amphidinium_carterae.1